MTQTKDQQWYQFSMQQVKAIKTQFNKALHSTAYSFGFPLVPRSKPSLPAANELGR